MQQNMTLNLTTEEINLILEGLGNLPFVKVYSLIGKIQEQAAQQLQPENGQAKTAKQPTATEVQS
jgi:hypothetical protein